MHINKPSTILFFLQIVALDRKVQGLEAANKLLEKQYRSALEELLKKDMKISSLEKQLYDKNTSDNAMEILDKPSNISGSTDRVMPSGVLPCSTLYKEFESLFDNDELKELRSVPLNQKKDCEFIRLLCKILYKCVPGAFLNRCYKQFNRKLGVNPKNGKPYETKKEITPEKKKIIQKIYMARLKPQVTATNFAEIEKRKNNFSKHINSAFFNLGRKYRATNERLGIDELEFDDVIEYDGDDHGGME